MTKTFDDLGIPFPLFAGPVEDASEYEGVATCSLCRREGHCFSLGIGADVVTSCPGCGSVNAIDADDREGKCSACGKALSIGDDAEELHACYACLREGKVALTKDAELGMIRWEDAVRGETHGLPGPPRPQEPERVFQVGASGAVTLPDTLPTPKPDSGDEDDDGWTRFELDPRWMFELLRTPAYRTWQGETWQLHDKVPMRYIGTWGRRQFAEHAKDGDGERLFRQLVDTPPPGCWSDWLGEDRTDHGITVYVSRSQDGSVLKAHYDMD